MDHDLVDDLETMDELEEDERPWSDMSPDVLGLIVGAMSIGDRISSSRVCKHWRSACMAVRRPSAYGHPCLLRLPRLHRKMYTLTDPLRGERFVIAAPDLPYGFSILCSDHGWLLLATTDGDDGIQVILFFNPLTGTAVGLPAIRTTFVETFTFSSPPTSPDCVVVSIFSTVDGNVIRFSYCRPGDVAWTDGDVRHEEGTMFQASSDSKPLLFKDRIYVMDVSGTGNRVGVYDIFAGRTLIKVIEPPATMIEHEYGSDYLFNLMEMDGKVILIYVDFCSEFVQIYELDESDAQDRWTDLNLKSAGRADDYLFFCNSVSGISMKAAPAASRRGEMVVHTWVKYSNGVGVSSSCCEPDEIRHVGVTTEDMNDFTTAACWIELKP